MRKIEVLRTEQIIGSETRRDAHKVREEFKVLSICPCKRQQGYITCVSEVQVCCTTAVAHFEATRITPNV